MKTKVFHVEQDSQTLKDLAEHLGVKILDLRVSTPFLGLSFSNQEEFKECMKSLYLRKKVEGYPPMHFEVPSGILCFRGHFTTFPDDAPYSIKTKQQVRWVLLQEDGTNYYPETLEEVMSLFPDKEEQDKLVKAISNIITAQGYIEVKLK